MALIALDAGHGGVNPGAQYDGRAEKDDVLALTLEVGRILEESGVEVYYTRTADIYESPYQKAQEANEVGADYFVSIHRNSSPYPNQYTGVETLVFNRYGEAARMAYNINEQLEAVGFVNLGVNERPNLVVLNRTQMPAVLVEVGFINTDADNLLFDKRFYEIAQAIADGILVTLGM
ncbi:MAG: N-acetylmuramoyl-L-alanine amidase [Lachnospiraceae bacterium]|nr:N-acetylmuramoyl-L-alanine amidase [Lachnospiraceae bacterium]